LNRFWRFFGADEPNYATMKDGRALLTELGALAPHIVYFRAHNLLSTGDGTPAFKWGSTNIYTEDANGNPIYDWTIVDHIFDTYIARGIHPYAQAGFMPQALSIHPEPYQHTWRPGLGYQQIATGWTYPPKDYARWAELLNRWAAHCVERYGREEVEKWYWEIWNEPNLSFYWKGTPEEFYKLHDYAVDAIRRALPNARVGGPDAAGGGTAFLDGFLDHITNGTNYVTGQQGTPTDFLSFHAKGQPKFVEGHVRMGISSQLTDLDKGFTMIAARPALKAKPIVIGESDPDGCAACQGPQLGYRNGLMYSSYTAASFARKPDIAAKHGVNLEGAITWAFEFEDQPYFAGFRQLASNGLDLPVLNVFRMFARMEGQRVSASSDGQIALDDIIANGVRGKPDVGVLASYAKGKLAVFVWHYHDDDVAGDDAAVSLSLAGLPKGLVKVTHYRIDDTHSNVYAAWKRMGSPAAPNDQQYAALKSADGLETMDAPGPLNVSRGRAKLEFTLPRQAVSLVVVESE
jgi:xylan 1,4-beta-xylosidase